MSHNGQDPSYVLGSNLAKILTLPLPLINLSSLTKKGNLKSVLGRFLMVLRTGQGTGAFRADWPNCAFFKGLLEIQCKIHE